MKVMRRWLPGCAILLGLVAFSVTFPFYRSYHPTHLGRWSSSWAAVIATTWILTGCAALLAMQPLRRPRLAWNVPAKLASLAFALWALVHCGEAWHGGVSTLGGAILQGRLLIAVTTPGVAVEWCAAALFTAAVLMQLHVLVQRTTSPASNTRLLAQRMALSLASTCVALLLCEGGYRVRNLILPRPQGLPTPSGRIFEARHYRRNSLGFRDREHTLMKPRGTIRIACIGDSYTEGLGVLEADRFTAVLERELRGRYGFGQVEVLNGGIADTNTEDHRVALERLLPYDPDIVLLIYVYNDIEHVAPPVRWSRMPKVERFVLKFLVDNSHLGAEIVARLRNVGFLSYEPLPERSAYFDPVKLAAHVRMLRSFFDRCQQAGSIAVLVPFDTLVTTRPIFTARDDRLCDAAARAAIPVWRDDTLFSGLPLPELKVSPTDWHPSTRAHQIFGMALARRLAASGYLGQQPAATSRGDPPAGGNR